MVHNKIIVKNIKIHIDALFVSLESSAMHQNMSNVTLVYIIYLFLYIVFS